MRILYFQSNLPLTSFSEACLSLTPKIFVHKDQELFLDIEVTRKFFGGEANQLKAAEALCQSFEIPPQYVVTDRPEWARPLALLPQIALPPGKSQAYLATLPIERLILCGDPGVVDEEIKERERLVAFMRRVGMNLISDFTTLSPTAIGRRFGKMGMRLQEWVLGNREVCLPQLEIKEKIKEAIDTEALGSLEALLFNLRQIFIRIEARLRGRNMLAKVFVFTFYPESGNQIVKHLNLAEPLREANALLKILRDFFSDVQWDSPLQRLEIDVADTIQFQGGQLSLFDTTENQFSDLAQSIHRWRHRFGEQAVGFADLQESYLPERSWKAAWPLPRQPLPERIPRVRPPFIFSPPKPYSLTHNLRLIPSENLATEWWREGGNRRYFIAETPRGEKLWVYWDGKKQAWFLHGTFD
jgi:hypothetical protein